MYLTYLLHSCWEHIGGWQQWIDGENFFRFHSEHVSWVVLGWSGRVGCSLPLLCNACEAASGSLLWLLIYEFLFGLKLFLVNGIYLLIHFSSLCLGSNSWPQAFQACTYTNWTKSPNPAHVFWWVNQNSSCWELLLLGINLSLYFSYCWLPIFLFFLTDHPTFSGVFILLNLCHW